MRKLTPFVVGAGLLAAGAASAADLSVRRSQPVAPAFAPVLAFSWTVAMSAWMPAITGPMPG